MVVSHCCRGCTVSSTMLQLPMFWEASDRPAPIEHFAFCRSLLGLRRFLPMPQLPDTNPTSEHSLYLRLFVTNSGGV